MELQSTEQMTFQRREWTVQKIGTVVLVAFVLAGLLGLFGVGPLASTTQSSPEGLVEVEYDRVTRSNTDDQITLTFSPEAVENSPEDGSAPSICRASPRNLRINKRSPMVRP